MKMKVWELIEELQQCPPDAHVALYDPDMEIYVTGVVKALVDIDEIALDWEYYD